MATLNPIKIGDTGEQFKNKINANEDALNNDIKTLQANLKPATTTTLGTIIVGDNLTIDANGKLNGSKGETDHRNLTNRDAANQHSIAAITGLAPELAKLNAIPSGANSGNPLMTNADLQNGLNQMTFIRLKDTPNSLTANCYLYVDETGKMIMKTETAVERYVDKVTDKDGIEFTKVKQFVFNKQAGTFNSLTSTLTLTPVLKTTDLLDMPTTIENNKLLVGNGDKLTYELKDIDQVTKAYENYVKIITDDTTEFWLTQVDGKYIQPIEHRLDSSNLILSFYNEDETSMSPLSYKIIDNSTIELYSDTPVYTRVIINCSQGTMRDSDEDITPIYPWQYLDDVNIRLDKSYSSTKIMSLLGTYALSSTVYSKTQSNNLFSSKTYEHTHSNKATLDLIGENDGVLTYKGQVVSAKNEPYTYSNHEQDVQLNVLTQVIDIGELFTSLGYRAIMNCEISFRNDYEYIEEDPDEADKMLQLVVTDNTIEELNVLIPPSQVQRYILGVSNSKKVYAKGKFSYNIYISAF